MTGDKDKLLQVLDTMMVDGGSTNIAAAMQLSGEQFDYNNDERRRIIVFLTDGKDTNGNSNQTILNKVYSLASKRVTINTIALGNNVDAELLKKIAEVSQGGYFYINNDPNLSQEDIDRQIDLIYEKLTRQITLAKIAEADLTPEKVTPIKFAAMYYGVDFEEARRWMTSSNTNLLTGNFVEQVKDINIDSTGPDLALERTYNSAAAGIKTIQGNGWRLNYDSKIEPADNLLEVTASTLNVRKKPWGEIIDKISRGTKVTKLKEEGDWYYVQLPDPNIKGYVAGWYLKSIKGVEVTYGSGSVVTFEENGGGGYNTPYEVYDTLAKDGSGYVLTQKDQTKYKYNSSGRLSAMEDRYGNQLTISYSGDKIDKVTDQVGRTLTFSYSGNKLTRIADPAGRHVDYEYDANENLIKATDLSGKPTTYSYYDKTNKLNPNKLKQITDANGHQVIKNDYDLFGRLVRQYDGSSYIKYHIYNDKYEDEKDKTLERYFINENGNESKVAFNTDHKPVEERDTYGNFSKHKYYVKYNDSWEDVSQLGEKDPLYDKYYREIRTENRPTKEIVTDKNGHPTTYEYDERKNNVSITDPHKKTAYMEYDGKNNLTSYKDKNGYTTSYEYDNGINLTKEKDPLGNIVEYTYYTSTTVKGLLKYKKDKNGNVTTYEYDDAQNNLTKVIDPLTYPTSYEYDNVGRKVKETNAKGFSTTYQYDNMDRLLTETDALGNSTTSEYDNVGNPIAGIDQNGSRTEYEYDDENQLIKVTDPLGGVQTNKYDPSGNKIEETDELGRVTKYKYDALNRVIGVVDALGGVSSYKYDPEGNKTGETDALGRETKYSYDYLNRLKGLEDALGYKEAYEYDASGNRTSFKDKNDNITTYQYDKLNRLVSQKEPNTAVTTSEYDANGNRIRVIDALGRETVTVYDQLNRPSTVKDALGNETVYQYDSVGNKKLEKDARGNPTFYEYDKLNRLVKVTDALNNFSAMEYDAVGNNTAKADKRGNRTEYAYDKLNRLSEVKDPYHNLTKYEYDAAGNKTAFIDPKGNKITHEYDGLDRLTREIDKNGNTKSYGYDAVNNKTSETSPMGYTTQFSYDKLNRLSAVSDPENTPTSYKYDKAGNLLEVTTGRGNTTKYQYNNVNKPKRMTDPAGRAETYDYDLVKNLKTKTDRNGVTTSYDYDALNRMKQESAGSVTISYDYDEVGSRKEMNDATGKTSYVYDELNRLKEKTLPDGSKISYTFDAEGNRTSVSDPAGNLTEYTYDNMNRMKTVKAAGGETVYDYDENGNRKSLLYPNSTKTEYEYDYRNLLTKLSITIPNTNPDAAQAQAAEIEKLSSTVQAIKGSTNAAPDVNTAKPAEAGDVPQTGNSVKETVYDTSDATVNSQVYGSGLPESAVKSENQDSVAGDVYGAPTVTGSVYDDQTSVAEQVYAQPSVRTFNLEPSRVIDLGGGKVTLVYIYEYGYNENGNQAYKVEPGNRKTDFTYDTLDRINTVTGPDSKVTTYSYDGAGNRLTEAVSGAGENKLLTYNYDSCNRLTRVDHTGDVTKTIQYTYDNNGNQTVVSEVYNGNTTTSSFGYDALNRLITVAKDGKTMIYAYNGDGLRTQKEVDGVTTTFYYTGKNILFEMDSDGNAYSNTLGINLIARSDGGKLNYYLFNGHGDVVMMIAPDGARENKYGYDIFGNLIYEQENGVKNPFRYAEYYYDSETGYYYLRARYYDPAIGRFVTEDSYKGGINDPLSLNLYTYCVNNPVAYSDPDGNWLIDALFLVADVVSFVKDPSLANAAWIAADIASFADPTGAASTAAHAVKAAKVGMGALKVVHEADKAKDIIKATEKAEDVVKATETAKNVARAEEPAKQAIKQKNISRSTRARNAEYYGTKSKKGMKAANKKGAGNGVTGRSGKQARLRELANDDKLSSALRGEINRDINEIKRGKRTNIRVPKGYNLAHRRGYEAKKGYGYEHSDLQIISSHKIQHKYEGY